MGQAVKPGRDGPRADCPPGRSNWKYHARFRTDNAAFWPLGQGPFLFDLESDPNELYSLIESMPELVAMLEAADAEMKGNLRGWV